MSAPLRVLIVTRHFPPIPSGGARRPYLMARALADAGAEVFVASHAPVGEFPGLQHPHHHAEPGDDVNPLGLQLWRWGPRRWARELLRWPDPDVRWSTALAGAVEADLPFEPDWILTSSPPESLLLVGRRLKRKYGCRWIADFRDCWLEPPRRPERRLFWRRIGERLQARALLAEADQVTAVDETVAAEIGRLSGVNVDVLPQLTPVPVNGAPLEPRDAVHVVYTGQFTIGDPGRKLQTLLEVFEAARERNPALALHVAGHLTQGERSALLETPSADRVLYYGALPLDSVLSLQSAADGLIVQSGEFEWAVPGKLFEYRATGVPIIAIGSGVWRQRAGLPLEGDPVSELAALRRAGRARSAKRPADAGRDQFLSILGAA